MCKDKIVGKGLLCFFSFYVVWRSIYRQWSCPWSQQIPNRPNTRSRLNISFFLYWCTYLSYLWNATKPNQCSWGGTLTCSIIWILLVSCDMLQKSIYIKTYQVRTRTTKRKGMWWMSPETMYAEVELNMFLYPLPAKTVSVHTTLISLSMQRKLYAFPGIITRLQTKKHNTKYIRYFLLDVYWQVATLHRLQQQHQLYLHVIWYSMEISLKTIRRNN